jgi:glutathione peroxidase
VIAALCAAGCASVDDEQGPFVYDEFAAQPAAVAAPTPVAAPASAAEPAPTPAAAPTPMRLPTAAPTPASAPAPQPATQENAMTPTPTAPSPLPASFHALKTNSLDGKPANLADYKGKVLLVVNVASECGLTPQYTGLEKLHEELSGKGFTVLGFPSNDFGGQEPGTPEQIQQFCSTKYDVKFPLFNKVQTKPGEGQSPVYAWLGAKGGHLPRWNFGKYVIGKDGQTVAYFDSKVEPNDPALRKEIDKALAAK